MARTPRGGTRAPCIQWVREREPAQHAEEQRRDQVEHDLARLLARGAVRVVIGPSQEGDDDVRDSPGAPPGVRRSRVPR